MLVLLQLVDLLGPPFSGNVPTFPLTLACIFKGYKLHTIRACGNRRDQPYTQIFKLCEPADLLVPALAERSEGSDKFAGNEVWDVECVIEVV
jgi:hypothetical protein